MPTNTNIFRAYDIRGNAEKDLDSSTIENRVCLGLKIKENNSNSVYVVMTVDCLGRDKSNLIRGINARSKSA